MALLSDDEVRLRISADTVGGTAVEQLAQSIDHLSTQSGEAAPRFEALANEVRALGQQQIRITGLEAAISSAKQAWAAVSEARREVQALDKALSDAKGAGANSQAIRVLQAELRAANGELAASEKAWSRQKDVLAETRAAAAGVGVDTRNLAGEQARLSSALTSVTQRVEEQKAALEAERAALEAVQAEARAQANEEARLAEIVEVSKTRQKLAAQELLAAEKKAYAEAEQASARAASQRAKEAAEVEAFSRRTKRALSDAFSAAGIRSSGEIQAEILKIQQSLLKLGANAKVSGEDFDRAFEAAQRRISALRAELAGGVDPFTRSVGQATAGIGQFTTALKPVAAAMAAAFGAQEVARMAADFDSLNRAMAAIQGQGAKAAAEVGYITDAARRLGLDLQSTAKTYTGWLASIKGTALEGERGRQVFEAVAGSMAKLGKSSADAEGAMLALGQMVSKGTVSLEELRGQLAERLPGALQAAAEGAGLTTAQLIKMVESGTVLAEDLLPGMAAQLNKLYGNQSADSLTSQWNRLTNAIFETVGQITQTEVVLTTTGAVLGAVKEVVLVLGTGFVTAAEGVGLLAKTLGATAAAISSGNWSGLREEIGKMATESADRINKLAGQTLIAQGVQKAFGDAVEMSGKQAAGATPQWLAITAAYTEVTKASEKYIQLVEKAAAARQAESQVALTYVEQFGTEAEKRAEAADQAEIQAAALTKLAQAKDAAAKIAESQIAAVQAEAAAIVEAGGKISQAKQDEINKLIELGKLKKEEAAQAAAAATTAQITAAALQAESLALADNSKRVGELRDAWKAAAADSEALNAAMKLGIVTKEDAAAASIKAGQAEKLYRDALSDTIASIQAKALVARTAISVEERGRALQLETIQTQIEVARARGRDNEVARLQIEYSRVQMELANLKAKALRAEADAQIALIAAKRAELEASGQLTEVKRLELDAALKAAEAKKIDAQIAEELASRARQLKDVVRGTGDAMTDAARSADRLGESWSSAADSADRYADSAARAARSTDGTRNADGTVNRTVFTSTQDGYTRGIELGLTKEQAKIFASEYADEVIRANAEARGKAAATGGIAFGVDDYLNYQRQAEQRAYETARRSAEASSSGSSGNSAKGVGMGNIARTTYNVDLRTNTGVQSIAVTDAASAERLVGVLKELASSS